LIGVDVDLDTASTLIGADDYLTLGLWGGKPW
jgi:hypothetical protein